jgi:DNA-binding response OmpR family regulator
MAASVLIVDDEKNILVTLGRALRVEGYDVDVAGSGKLALERCKLKTYDAILLDVQLPDLDGFEVASRLTSDGGGPRVVLVSSRDRADYGSRIEESGASGFIAKAELCGPALAALMG